MFVHSFAVTEGEAGHRLDTIVAARIPTLSRSYAARLIRAGYVTVNGQAKKSASAMNCGDLVRAEIPPAQPITCTPEPIPLSILFEDTDIIVVNKPPGLVVHPAAGHWRGTLVNGLLYHCHDLKGIGGELRPGIVHRLDKDTSGTIVVAKNDMAHESLSSQFKSRKVQKRYLALVYGKPKTSAGVINLPLGRHPTDRKKMSTRSRQHKPTETRWKIKECFSGVTLLELELRTGRTHQIRVHCAAMGHPVAGDVTYGSQRRWKALVTKDMQDILRTVQRHMLHAWKLVFMHPATGELVQFESPVSADMAGVLELLRGLSAT